MNTQRLWTKETANPGPNPLLLNSLTGESEVESDLLKIGPVEM
jgi:hypothetical protein